MNQIAVSISTLSSGSLCRNRYLISHSNGIRTALCRNRQFLCCRSCSIYFYIDSAAPYYFSGTVLYFCIKNPVSGASCLPGVDIAFSKRRSQTIPAVRIFIIDQITISVRSASTTCTGCNLYHITLLHRTGTCKSNDTEALCRSYCNIISSTGSITCHALCRQHRT